MTLLTAISAGDWVAMAADRRITATGLWQADTETKVAVVDGEFIISYTGDVPAFEGRLGYERWLADAVGSLSSGNLLDHLRDYANADQQFRGKRFMLLAVGFAPDTWGRPGPAQIVVISNSMTADGEPRSTGPIEEFVILPLEPPAGSLNKWVAATRGVPVDPKDIDIHFANLKLRREFREDKLPGLYNAIGDLYTDVESLSGGSVGADVIVVLLPREGFHAHGVQGVNIGIGAWPSEIRSVYLSRSDLTISDKYLPAFMESTRPGRNGLVMTHGRTEVGDGIDFMGPTVPMSEDGPGMY